MLDPSATNATPSYGTGLQQNNQLLGNPQLQPQSSPYFNSSYDGPPSSFFIPSSIPVPAQQQGQQPGVPSNLQAMIAALRGNGA